jgi:hypothetical protein
MYRGLAAEELAAFVGLDVKFGCLVVNLRIFVGKSAK